MNYIVPTIIEKQGQVERAYDIYSRLLKDRIIFLGTAIDDEVSNAVIAQLLFLDAQSDDDITIYINSPGGSVTSALAMYDTIQFIKSDVATTCVGIAASAASLLLAAGERGKRSILSNAEVMIHQVLGGVHGQASDIDIHAKHILKTKEKINKIMAKHTGQKVSVIEKDSDRDNFMSATEAKKYGIVDKIIK
ncbi:MAG: ATP-dependent Clp protease proteolytic subunit [Candidatus Moraniibacteriota bacterium]|nr:MAG: ATP-dependent Clp protease proteolytic subunit [Candidatus Moranbacteria bacterium]